SQWGLTAAATPARSAAWRRIIRTRPRSSTAALRDENTKSSPPAPPRSWISSDHRSAGMAIAPVRPFFPNTVICPDSPRGRRFAATPALQFRLLLRCPQLVQHLARIDREHLATGFATKARDWIVATLTAVFSPQAGHETFTQA